MINPMDLSGKKYVVTGASSGLGRQTCVTLTELGADVLMVARSEEKLKETAGICNGNIAGGGYCETLSLRPEQY